MTDTDRGRRLPTQGRRESILAAALDLFGRHNYEAVGMRDLAAVCGLSATAIYRHFANKEALLIGLFDMLSDLIASGMREASRAKSPRQALDGLIKFHVRLVSDQPALFSLYLRAEISLPHTERRRFREIQHHYVAIWTENLLQVRPDVTASSARTIVVAAFGAMNAMSFHNSDLSGRALERLLVELIERLLGIYVSPEDS